MSQDHQWFHGNFSNWKEALEHSKGYDSPAILQKVIESTRKVINGEAAFERDSFAFDKIEYSMPLLVSLLYAASKLENHLHVLDFGGSLGSSYNQNLAFLSHIKNLTWSIVEQEQFVQAGQREFSNPQLKFYETIDSVYEIRKPNVFLFSGVLQCIENPKSIVDICINKAPDYIIVDRTPFFKKDLPYRICVETVPEHIYSASYPTAFFNYKEFLSWFTGKYELKEKFNGFDFQQLPDTEVEFLCLLLVKK